MPPFGFFCWHYLSVSWTLGEFGFPGTRYIEQATVQQIAMAMTRKMGKARLLLMTNA